MTPGKQPADAEPEAEPSRPKSESDRVVPADDGSDAETINGVQLPREQVPTSSAKRITLSYLELGDALPAEEEPTERASEGLPPNDADLKDLKAEIEAIRQEFAELA